MFVDFHHFRLFRDLAHERSISKGAENNGISQSAASQHLQELERNLGVILVDRSTRPLQLTEAGRIYCDFCQDILHRKEEFDAAIERLKEKVEGQVRVASIYSVGLSEMSRLEAEFNARYPEAELVVTYLRPEKVYEAILSDRADLGLVSYPSETKEINVTAWRQERMVVVAAPAHPLAQKVWLQPADLQGVDFVGFDEDLPIAAHIKQYFEDASVKVNITMHFDNIQMMKEAVALGEGLSILPVRILKQEVEQGRLVAIRLDKPALFRPLGIIHHSRKRFNRAAESFLALLREEEPA
ncbi:MAG: LysR family transcriptional regulator [Acidobacteria bacterium]|nr:LysR family transcriptional regulator [Acidobacteriota bacterium]